MAVARDEDPEAFGALYDAHAGRVYALCLRMTGDAARAADLVQDVFLRAWEGLDAFRGDSQFGTWLHRIAVNEVLMQTRSDRRRTARVALVDDQPHPMAEPRAQATDTALRMDIERAVAGLPPVLRAVFVLHDIEGYPHDQIAQLLDMPAGTSRSHLFRARRLLREELS